MDDTIVAVRFTDLDQARAALHELERLDRDGRLRVRGAALVERSGDGRIAGADDADFAPPGGVFGMLVDALRGPGALLFAQPTESFRGHGAPSPHADERADALDEMNRNLEPGVTVVVAEIEDPDPGVLQSAVDGLGGKATVRPAEDVYAEIRARERS